MLVLSLGLGKNYKATLLLLAHAYCVGLRAQMGRARWGRQSLNSETGPPHQGLYQDRLAYAYCVGLRAQMGRARRRQQSSAVTLCTRKLVPPTKDPSRDKKSVVASVFNIAAHSHTSTHAHSQTQVHTPIGRTPVPPPPTYPPDTNLPAGGQEGNENKGICRRVGPSRKRRIPSVSDGRRNQDPSCAGRRFAKAFGPVEALRSFKSAEVRRAAVPRKFQIRFLL